MVTRVWLALLLLAGCGEVTRTPSPTPSDGGSPSEAPALGAPPAPNCSAADHTAGPVRLEGARDAWLGPCGELLYSDARQRELWFARGDGSDPELLTGIWSSGRARFSLQGDRLYFGEQFGNVATLSVRELASGKTTALPTDLVQVVWCGGRDVLVTRIGSSVAILDADLQTLGSHDFSTDELVVSDRDCKLLALSTDIQVLQLNEPTRAPVALSRRVVAPGSGDIEQFRSVPYQPLVLHEFVRSVPCGDTSCQTEAATELFEIRSEPRAALTSSEGPNASHLLLSSPPGDGAVLHVAADYHLAKDGDIELVRGYTPTQVLRDQRTLLATAKGADGESALVLGRGGAKSELVPRVGGGWALDDNESSVLIKTTPPGVAREGARSLELRWAPLDGSSAPRLIRQVPSDAEIVWAGPDGRCLLRAPNATLRPPLEVADLALAGDYLLAADGSVERRWPKWAVLVVRHAAGHVLLVSTSGACLDETCEQHDPSGIELVPESGEAPTITGAGPVTARVELDSSSTRYLIQLGNEYWTGQLSPR